MKVRSIFSMFAIGAAVASSCAPIPPRPSAVPIVESVVVAPSPATAGEPMTITITALDDDGITEILPTFATGPNGAGLNFQPVCVVGEIVPDIDGRAVIDVVCDLPAIMTNGDWSLKFYVGDGGFPFGEGDAEFTVTGGSDDMTAPTVTDAAIPENPAPGEEFHIIAQIEDETGPITGPLGLVFEGMILQNPGQESILCSLVQTPLTATTWEFDYTCIPEEPFSGTFTTTMQYADALNQTTIYQHTVTVG